MKKIMIHSVFQEEQWPSNRR